NFYCRVHLLWTDCRSASLGVAANSARIAGLGAIDAHPLATAVGGPPARWRRKSAALSNVPWHGRRGPDHRVRGFHGNLLSDQPGGVRRRRVDDLGKRTVGGGTRLRRGPTGRGRHHVGDRPATMASARRAIRSRATRAVAERMTLR